jgi:lysophospholipase L1-like esterase
MRVLAAACLISLMTVGARAAPAIDWRIEHPFRYFTETTDFDMQREAASEVMSGNHGALTATAVSDIERLLNDPRWLREWFKTNPLLYSDPKRSGRPERGWSNPINLRRATCWDHRAQWHSSCASDSFGTRLRTDYVRPQGHTVIIAVADAPAGTCRWQAARPIFVTDRAELSAEVAVPCASKVRSRIPFEPERPEADRGVSVTVTLPDGTELSQAPIWVHDRLIVGIGDSFSSGEGNPDNPVEIDTGSTHAGLNFGFVYDPVTQAIKSVASYSLPVRDRNIPAGWIDRKCHRSAYGYQLRTALQVALADPKHSAVTFLGYACSGAKIVSGLLFPYAGVEAVGVYQFTADGARRRDLSQLDRIMAELCRDDPLRSGARRTVTFDTPLTGADGNKVGKVKLFDCKPDRFLRPIDLLMISIGGNDVGFVPLIADVLTRKKPPYADGKSRRRARQLGAPLVRIMARITQAHNVKEARGKAQELPARFAALRKALAPLPIATGAGGRPNIILTAFPKVEFNQDGRLCGETKPRERLEGLNVGGALSIDVPTLREVSDFANNTLFPALRDAARAGGWSFVDAHRGPFGTHGLCAQRRIAEDKVTAAENLMLPYYHFGSPRNVWSEFDPFSSNREDNFDPLRDTRPYAPRQRWFRTLNDICLFVQFKAKGTPPPPRQWGLANLIEACLGGPFHPTAEGHAHIADAVYATAKTILALPDPTVAEVRPY